MAGTFKILISSFLFFRADGFWFSRYQVRTGGLITAPPPPTTMRMPESNNTTSVKTITSHDVEEIADD